MKEELKDQSEALKKEMAEEVEIEEEKAGDGPVETKQEETEDSTNLDSLEEAKKVIAEMQVTMRDMHAELEEQKNLALRLQADFQNFRKRKEKEMSDTVRYANQELILLLLPIIDNFDRTLDAIEKTDNLAAIKDGISVVEKSMKNQLTKIGLEPIQSVEKEFDSELHEAVTSVPVEDDKKGKVIDEVEKGYRLKDKVIRFSKVIVGE